MKSKLGPILVVKQLGKRFTDGISIQTPRKRSRKSGNTVTAGQGVIVASYSGTHSTWTIPLIKMQLFTVAIDDMLNVQRKTVQDLTQ